MSDESGEWPTMLRQGGIQQRMQCNGSVAHIIEETFVTVPQLLEAVESDAPLTEIDGIGPKTAAVIEDWYEHREEREANARSAIVTPTSKKSAMISFHPSWADALGIEEDDR